MPGQRVFREVAVERKFKGRSIEVGAAEGWQWSELGPPRPDSGATSRADLDALRLIAVVLGHWDNKPTNQRLVCLDGDPEHAGGDGPCADPLVMLQDVGATFGPTKVNLDRWTETPVWADQARCLVSMRDLPYDGATFVDAEISEAGRRVLATRLRALSTRQIEELFAGAAFPGVGDEANGEASAEVAAWVRALQNKIQQIVDRPPCPD
jgi:hypothetical protein